MRIITLVLLILSVVLMGLTEYFQNKTEELEVYLKSLLGKMQIGGEKVREKSEAQKFLEQYNFNAVKTECKLEERRFWHDLSLSITGQMGGERVQSSGDHDKMGKARDICVDMEGDILEQVLRLASVSKEVTGVLDRLDNPTEYKLLHMKYIQNKELKVIADSFKSDYTWATTCHGRALKSVEAILNSKIVTSCD